MFRIVSALISDQLILFIFGQYYNWVNNYKLFYQVDNIGFIYQHKLKEIFQYLNHNQAFVTNKPQSQLNLNQSQLTLNQSEINLNHIQIIMSTKILPLAVLDKCIGSNIWILMKGQRQFAGVLRGFDDFFNMVMQNVTQTWIQQGGNQQKRQIQQILLNGHDIAFMVPGVNPYSKKQPQQQNKQ